MLRKAFTLAVDEARIAEYARRHQPIWPELAETLRAHGVRSYSIFHLPGSGLLFAYAEIEDAERWAAIANTTVCRRWWRSMAEVMPSAGPDHAPVSRDLAEVFHLNNPR